MSFHFCRDRYRPASFANMSSHFSDRKGGHAQARVPKIFNNGDDQDVDCLVVPVKIPYRLGKGLGTKNLRVWRMSFELSSRPPVLPACW
jgi:hypothetical protein